MFEHLLDIVEGRRPMPEPSAKFHHYVPQMHLRSFSPNPAPPQSARVAVLDKQSGQVAERAIASVGGKHRFNRVQGPDNHPSDAVEGFFSVVESHAAPALARLVTGVAPSYPDRMTISFYLALQAGRTPHGIANAHHASEITLGAHLGMWTESPRWFADMCKGAGLDETPEAIEDLRERMQTPGCLRIADPRTEGLRLGLSVSGELTSIILESNWTLLRSSESLAVGDHPITHHHTSPPRFPWTAPAWMSTPNTESFFPIDSHHALLTTPPRQPIRGFQTKTLSAPASLELNLRSFGWATRFVFAEGEGTLRKLADEARRLPSGIPQASAPKQIVLAEDRAFLLSERNEQPDGWPPLLPGLDPGGHRRWYRYKVVRFDRPAEMSAAMQWATRAEQRLYPGVKPRLATGSREDIGLLVG